MHDYSILFYSFATFDTRHFSPNQDSNIIIRLAKEFEICMAENISLESARSVGMTFSCEWLPDKV